MTVYTSWMFGKLTIRNCETDEVVWSAKRRYAISAMDHAIEYAEGVAKRNGWTVV